LVTILILVGREEYDEELKDIAEIARETRYWNDKILYVTRMKIFELINKKFGLSESDDTGDYITIDEALSDVLPSNEEIQKRKTSWVMIDDKALYTDGDVEDFLNSHGIIIKEDKIEIDDSLTTISGRSAQKGFARGTVKTVFTMQDVEKVNEGDIIVSPMTGPDFIMAIKKSAGIITDEGGITCHAAIVARELGKPCIIGIKIATQILKDGMVVEVDADKGVVKIIK
jgi:phosphoenolpyruvate synthase/pyruvate phosphate dikinase